MNEKKDESSKDMASDIFCCREKTLINAKKYTFFFQESRKLLLAARHLNENIERVLAKNAEIYDPQNAGSHSEHMQKRAVALLLLYKTGLRTGGQKVRVGRMPSS